MLKLLEKMCALGGISGSEDEVRDFIKACASKYTDDIKTDVLGNLIVFKKGRKHDVPKLMIAAHMDEVGFMIESVDSDGFLKFAPVGGIDPRVTLGRKVYVGEKKIPGVMGLKAIHLTTAEERKDVPKWKNLYIDIGARDKEEALKKVSIGDAVVWDSDFVRIGKKLVKAKALDDRFGCALMLKLLEKDLPMDCSFVFTVMEEVGTRGALGSAFSVKPDLALVLEGTTSADTAKVDEAKKVTCLGKGPVLGFMDAGTIYDRGLFESLRDLADENDIPWQIKGRIAGGTDARAIQRSRAGVRVASISAPCRSIHSPNSVADIEDIENSYRLAQLFIEAVAEGKYR